MATYLNDLRLTELATGEGSGTWGTTTNLSLELIGEALGFATQQVFGSDADATTTIADGASDPARAMYFKITSAGSLTATRTCTIAPNTISRVMFIENATTGSQSIQISQGSGASVTILAGKTAVVYLDGAGSGAAVVDAMAGVDPGVTDTLAEVLAAGNTSGANNLIIDNGQAITTNTINETTAASGVTIDSVLLKDDGVNATNLEITNIKANDGTSAGSIANSTGVVTLASSVLTTADINGGTIDGAVIGGTTPAALSATTGSFSSTLGVTGAATFSSTVAGAFNGTLGATTPASVAATTLSTTGAATFGGDLILNEASPLLIFQISGVSKGYAGIAFTAGSIVADSATDDYVVRSANGDFRVSTDDGTTSALTIAQTTGAATFGGNVTGKNATFVTTTAASLISIGDTAAGTYSLLRMYGGSGKYNFQVGVQNNVNNAFEITPSTAVGGTTFTTPALLINGSNGNVGISESNPVAKIHIQGSGTSGQVTSSLILENSSSGTAGLQITGTAGSSHLDFMYGGAPSTGTNTLTTGMSMTLEGSGAGRVGIGTSSPAETLHVAGAIATTAGISGHGANRATFSQEGAGGAFIQSYGANTLTMGAFVFRQASSDFSLNATPLTISATGDATFSGTVNGLTLAPSASGNRWGVTAEVASNGVMEIGRYIDFHSTDGDTSDYGARLDYDGTNIVSTNAFSMASGIYLGGSVAANLLNDYETGVFTPTLSFGGASVGITYSNQYGRYTKVGRQVTVQVGVYLTSKGTSTGGAVVSGLPFNVTTQAGGFGSYAGTFKGAGMASLSNATNVIADENTTTLLLEENNASGASALTNANFTDATYFMATITYFN
jgi:hypothetical protein